MRGDLGSLYDAHAARLYAYCWSLVGDAEAAAALGDTFAAAVHRPPRGDHVLWLYALARSACADRGALTARSVRLGPGGPEPAADPLLRAAGALRPDHREALLLWAGEWLEPHDIAQVLGVAPDTAAQLLGIARTRLERAVLDALMRGAAGARPELITAFEKGRLPRLLASRAPSRAPAGLRERILAACEDEATRPLPTVSAPTPLVVIGPGAAAPRRGLMRTSRAGAAKRVGMVAGLAASAAAVAGLVASWPAARGGNAASLMPTAGDGRTRPASAGANSALPPGLTGSERATVGTHLGTADPVMDGRDGPRLPPGTSPGGGGTAPGTPSAPGSPARTPSESPSQGEDPAPSSPSRPTRPATPPDGGPTTPPATDPPTTPPPSDPPGATDPGTPPDTPTSPPVETPSTPSPSPATSPDPTPTQP